MLFLTLRKRTSESCLNSSTAGTHKTIFPTRLFCGPAADLPTEQLLLPG